MTDVTTDPADAPTTLRPVTTDAARAGVHSDQDADELRGAMVDEVIARRERLGLVPPREVEAALRTVPRHLFAPGVPLDKAYAGVLLPFVSASREPRPNPCSLPADPSRRTPPRRRYADSRG